MNNTEIKKKILILIKSILNIQIEIESNNLNDKLNEWDSLKQLTIVFALEEEFDIKLSNNEIEQCTNYNDICNIVIKLKND